MLKMFLDEVEVMVLPDGAACLADEKDRSPLELEKCPCGYETCSGNCAWYAE